MLQGKTISLPVRLFSLSVWVNFHLYVSFYLFLSFSLFIYLYLSVYLLVNSTLPYVPFLFLFSVYLYVSQFGVQILSHFSRLTYHVPKTIYVCVCVGLLEGVFVCVLDKMILNVVHFLFSQWQTKLSECCFRNWVFFADCIFSQHYQKNSVQLSTYVLRTWKRHREM